MVPKRSDAQEGTCMHPHEVYRRWRGDENCRAVPTKQGQQVPITVAQDAVDGYTAVRETFTVQAGSEPSDVASRLHTELGFPSASQRALAEQVRAGTRSYEPMPREPMDVRIRVQVRVQNDTLLLEDEAVVNTRNCCGECAAIDALALRTCSDLGLSKGDAVSLASAYKSRLSTASSSLQSAPVNTDGIVGDAPSSDSLPRLSPIERQQQQQQQHESEQQYHDGSLDEGVQPP